MSKGLKVFMVGALTASLVACGTAQGTIDMYSKYVGESKSVVPADTLNQGGVGVDVDSDSGQVIMTGVETNLSHLGGFDFSFSLENTSETDISLSFSNLQEVDYVVLSEAGSVVYKLSEDMSFGEAVVTKEIKSGERDTQRIDVSKALEGEEGLFIIDAWSTALELNNVNARVMIQVGEDGVEVLENSTNKPEGMSEEGQFEVDESVLSLIEDLDTDVAPALGVGVLVSQPNGGTVDIQTTDGMVRTFLLVEDVLTDLDDVVVDETVIEFEFLPISVETSVLTKVTSIQQ